VKIDEQEIVDNVIADFTQTLEQADRAITRLRRLIDLRLALQPSNGIEHHFNVNRVLNELKTVDRRIKRHQSP